MRHIKVVSAILSLLIIFACINMYVFADEEFSNGTAGSSCHTLDATTAYLGAVQITENVNATVVYETNSDTLMYAQNADAKMFPSSLVKIMTALIAVEKGNLEDPIVVTQEVLDTVPYYAASAELVAGEEISLSDLLYCMMVGSANDAAAVIATHICGSQDAFVAEMNAYAKKLGCNATQFVNVHGLHDEQQYTSARDMAKIASAAVKNDEFLKYFSAVHYELPATNKSEARKLDSGNFLMNFDDIQIYYDERVKGGRTGVTDDGLRCLATLAEQSNMQLVCIVMGSESTFSDSGSTLTYGSFKETSALLDAALGGFRVVQVLHEDQALKQCEVLNGENDVVLGARSSAYAVLPNDISVSDLSYQIQQTSAQLTAPITAGQTLSFVTIWYGNLCIGQADLAAMNSVRQLAADTQSDDSNSGNQQTGTTVLIIAIVVTAIVIFLLLRFSGKLKTLAPKTHRAEHRHNRRRDR